MVPDKMRTVGWLIDNAMEAVERENAKLKNVLNKDFARTQIDSHKLADLIAHFSDTNFSQPSYDGHALDLKSKDILGHVYEYFLGQFALAEGKKGGQYYTCYADRGDAAALQGSGVRPCHGFGWLLRAERGIRCSARRYGG
jgi:type I restriction enzyme M protein